MTNEDRVDETVDETRTALELQVQLSGAKLHDALVQLEDRGKHAIAVAKRTSAVAGLLLVLTATAVVGFVLGGVALRWFGTRSR